MAATPTSPDSFVISDSDSGDDDSVWAMDLDDDDDAADTPSVASPVGPNVTVGRVCARAAAARARARDRARAMARADAYLDLNGEARQAHAARQLRLDHLRRECAALRLSAALVLASAPDAVVTDADELLDQGYAADEVLAVVAATEPATAAAARRRWEVDDDEGPPLKSGMDRSATIARGLVRLFFADGTMKGLARCAAACDPTDYARDAAALRLLSSKLDLPLEIVRLVGEFAVQSPLARFSMVGRVDGAVLARLLRPHIDGIVGKLKRTKHFGRVVAVARGAAVALPAPKKPRRPKKKPLPKWNASSIKRDPRGVARHCLRGTRRRCFCVECWSSSK